MKRGIKGTAADSLLLEMLHQRGFAVARHQHVDEPWRDLLEISRRHLDAVDATQPVPIQRIERPLPRHDRSKAIHLRIADHCLEIGELQVPPDTEVMIAAAFEPSEVPQEVHSLRNLVTARQHRAALAGRHKLLGAE